MKKNAVYPGSFDPVTNGHLDIIKRASKIFDTLYVAILENSAKSPAFSMDERVELLKKVTADMDNVVIDKFSGLLVDYAESVDAHVIIKGLRAVSDFEYEFQMALMNRNLNRNIETLFMTTNEKYSYLSSSIVKEVAKHQGSLKGLVPEDLEKTILTKFEK